MLRWANELGRVHISHEISLLSQHQASPGEGHMEQVMRIFHCLSEKPKRSICVDPGMPAMDFSQFKQDATKFKECHCDTEEPMPHSQPKPKGKSVMTSGFADAARSAKKRTRRSHTGCILFVSRAPVKWICKRQQTVETSPFLFAIASYVGHIQKKESQTH